MASGQARTSVRRLTRIYNNYTVIYPTNQMPTMPSIQVRRRCMAAEFETAYAFVPVRQLLISCAYRRRVRQLHSTVQLAGWSGKAGRKSELVCRPAPCTLLQAVSTR